MLFRMVLINYVTCVRLTINIGSEYGDTLSATFSRGPTFLTSLQLASGCSHKMGGKL